MNHKHYEFDSFEIQKQFRLFLIQNGIVPFELELYFTPDGLIHRFRTQDDTQSEKSGAFCLFAQDWPAGWVEDWRNGKGAINWSFPREALNQEGKSFFSEKIYKEAVELSRTHQQEVLKLQREKQIEASENARLHFEQAQSANPAHPYLKDKNVLTLGLHETDRKIIVPLREVNGRFLSLQWIDPDGRKKFYPDAPTKGAFYA